MSNTNSDSDSVSSVNLTVINNGLFDELNISIEDESTLPKEYFSSSPASCREIVQVAQQLDSYINPLSNENYLPNADNRFTYALPDMYLTCNTSAMIDSDQVYEIPYYDDLAPPPTL